MGLPLRNANMAEEMGGAAGETLRHVGGALKLVKGLQEQEDIFYRLTEAAELVMGVEKSCITFYKTLANKRWSKETQELFGHLGEQEGQHYATFAWLVRSSQQGVATDEDWEAREAELRSAFHNSVYGWPDPSSGGLLQALSAVLFHGQAFGWPGDIMAAAQKVTREEPALRLAVDFEKDNLLLLYNLSDIVVDSDQELLDHVIAQEREHVQLLNERL